MSERAGSFLNAGARHNGAGSTSDAGAGVQQNGAGPVIGLTGPMCSGKNVAAAILSARGLYVVDADTVAHAALEDVKDRVFEAFEEMAKRRGLKLRDEQGSVQRRALASLVFSDPALLAAHEGIVYPRINELLSAEIDAHPEGIVINAPLLHKSPILGRCDFVIFVSAPLPLRLIRAVRRDSLPIKQIFARFFAQGDLYAQYLEKDVDIQRVPNHGSKRALERRLRRLLTSKGY